MEHVQLVVDVGGDRLRDRVRARAARAPAALADRADRWASPASSTRCPAWRCSSCCCRSPAAARRPRVIALTAYTLQIIFRNIITGLNNVPAEAQRRRPRRRSDRPPAPVAGRAAARAARHHRRAADRHHQHGRARHAGGLRRRRRPRLRDRRRQQHHVQDRRRRGGRAGAAAGAGDRRGPAARPVAADPLAAGAAGMIGTGVHAVFGFLSNFTGAFDFIFHEREAQTRRRPGGRPRGGRELHLGAHQDQRARRSPSPARSRSRPAWCSGTRAAASCSRSASRTSAGRFRASP